MFYILTAFDSTSFSQSLDSIDYTLTTVLDNYRTASITNNIISYYDNDLIVL